MNDGTVTCKKCWATLIAEELKNRKKYTPSYELEGDVLWVRWHDGKWYRHDLPPTAEMQQPKINNGIKHLMILHYNNN